MKQAYMQMQVDTESQQYFTVNPSKGLFTFTRMPFGISTAPNIWQREMDRVLSGIPGTVCYMDDILVVAPLSLSMHEKAQSSPSKVGQGRFETRNVSSEREKYRVSIYAM